MSVPFVDLSWENHTARAEILDAVAAVIDRGDFTLGRPVEEFERAWATFCSVRWCVGTSSGLDAIVIALRAGGLQPGQDVVVPALTFVATWEAVVHAGGRVVPCDVLDDDLCIDPVAAVATGYDPFLLPVHLYGQMADVAGLHPSGLPVIEDAAQAHGATADGWSPGSSTLAAAFSFYPTKNLGGIGDGGAIVTNSYDLAERAHWLRDHGQEAKNYHREVGYTARLDSIQAAALLAKLPRLPAMNLLRREAAQRYLSALAGVGDIRLPTERHGATHVWHLFPIRTRHRDALRRVLDAAGIGTGVHYPPPHRQKSFAHLGYKAGAFPVAERAASEIVTLPLFSGITEGQQAEVVAAIERFFS